jgi:hypothetical protein
MSVRLELTINDELNQDLERIAKEQSTSKAEVLRKATNLFLHAYQAKKQGRGMAFTEGGKVTAEIINL